MRTKVMRTKVMRTEVMRTKHAHEESTVQSDWCQGATEVMHGEQRERTLGSGTDIRTRVLEYYLCKGVS